MSARKKYLRVYFFRPRGMAGPIKIGCSTRPHQRIENFALWSPIPLELIGHVPGSMKDERYIQNCFAHLHLHHEWFDGKPDLLLAVENILEKGVQYARDHLKPTGNIRARVRTPESRQKMSETMKRAWVRRKAILAAAVLADRGNAAS